MKRKIFAILGILLVLFVVVVGVVYACGKIPICHHTGSTTNPYVEITVADDGWFDGHIKHKLDIIPMPAGGCPRPDPTATPTNTEEPTATATDTLEPTATATNTLEPTVTSTGTLEPTFTATATAVVITKEITPTIVKTLAPVVSRAPSCCVCCPIDKSKTIVAIYGLVDTYIVGDNADKIEVDECCWAKIYVDGTLKYHVNLSGWVVEYK